LFHKPFNSIAIEYDKVRLKTGEIARIFERICRDRNTIGAGDLTIAIVLVRDGVMPYESYQGIALSLVLIMDAIFV